MAISTFETLPFPNFKRMGASGLYHEIGWNVKFSSLCGWRAY